MIKRFLKNHQCVMDIVALVYNLLFSKCRVALIIGRLNAKGSFLKGTKIRIKGNSKVTIGRMARLQNCKIIINGNGCNLEIGGGSSIVSNTVFYEEDDNCSIIVGRHFTMEGGHIAATEGKSITIGEDCMFSGDVEIRNGDSHVILEKGTKKRTNNAMPVVIDNHVWLTAHVRVLKGSVIADNCIIGNSSVVSGKLELPNCIYCGIPVVKIKENIEWDRFRNKNWN